MFLTFITSILLSFTAFHAPRLHSSGSELEVPLFAFLQTYYSHLQKVLTGDTAYQTVAVLQNYWRYGGNPDFNRSMDYIARRLLQNGFTEAGSHFVLLRNRVDLEDQVTWQPYAATLEIISPLDTIIASMDDARTILCIYSHPTPPAGVSAELVFVDTMQAVRANQLRGKIAYTHRPPREVFRRAVETGGAVGIVSSFVPFYNRPAEHPHSVSMSSIPLSQQRSVFGFKISYAAGRFLDSLLTRGPVRVRARVDSDFLPKRVHEVSALIKGTQRPEESIVLIAHVDEPGANDNASGSGTLLELAIALKDLIASGILSPPARTLRFMWVEEIDTIRRWRQAQPEAFNSVVAALVLDMVGQNTALTGGTFLIEKAPDPAAVWTRPPDRHTEWGQAAISPSALRGTYLNDLMVAACSLVARYESWNVATNPFEGGSDHVPFLEQGIPAVLAWHFTDVYYHTSGDQIRNVSKKEMRRVALATASAALFLANADTVQALALLEYLKRQAGWRLRNELQHSLTALRQAPDSMKVLKEQLAIIQAWKQWFHQAFESIRSLPIHSENSLIDRHIRLAQQQINQEYQQAINRLNHGQESQ